MVEMIQSLVNPTLPLESDVSISHIFLSSSYVFGQGGIPPTLKVPHPIPKVILFDWNSLVEPWIPSNIPLQINVEVSSTTICRSIVDEWAFIIILSSMAWKVVVSPPIELASSHVLEFDRSASQPLGILPQWPITLGGKTIYIDVMVVQGPLDINFLLFRDDVYAMKLVESSLFRVIHFPHNGKIMTINQLSFVNSCTIISQP